ncbi:1-acyl-sn-glycerol-3-phosphate acyltransferase epsilon-like [Clavelina lepadiformis]|uniref:1-acyl-sn-glycerol-3-phosphate acyltransferase epsilon-like n=1 Tax=Clavelina lepadiformis TaxID=159417 RepID=UPI0040418601
MAIFNIVKELHRIIRGAIGTTIMVAVSPTYLLIHTTWRLISLPLPWKYFYKGDDFLWGSYQKVIIFFFEHTTGAEIFISGDIPKEKENVILICNHQCTMDWIVTDVLSIRQNMVGNLRYVFKDSIKYMPLYGYVFGVHGGVFVRRDGLYNERNMKKVLNGLIQSEVDMYFVIFPEGTRFSEKREKLLQKSQAYAIENDLRPLNQVLTPRIKAFHCAITSMRKYVDAVYDATIIYDEKDRPKTASVRPSAPNMWRFLVSSSPQIYIRFDRIVMDKIPCSSQKTTMSWLHSRFERKNSLLCRHFSIEELKEEEDCIAGVVTKYRRQIDDGEDLRDGTLSTLSITHTLPSAFFYITATAALWCHSMGRKIYVGALLGGSIATVTYAKAFF